MYNIEKFDKMKKDLPNVEDYTNLRIRIHRVISWLKCANNCYENDDQFYIFSWIAFNAMYNIVNREQETILITNFLYKVLDYDKNKTFYNILLNYNRNDIEALLNNKYVFEKYWRYKTHGGLEYNNWEEQFETEKYHISNAFKVGETHLILKLVFSRLYVLRNQILHGCATYQSEVNRKQVKPACKIIHVLNTGFIMIMLTNENEDWGKIPYPPMHTS